jgi:hypothetical protein
MYAGVTVHINCYRNDRGDHVLVVEDDASRFLFDVIETDASSAAGSFDLPKSVSEQLDSPMPILEDITDHGSEFMNSRHDDRPDLDREFERYLLERTLRTFSVKSGDRSRTARSSGSFRPTRNSASDSNHSRSFSTSTTRCDRI